MTFIPSEQYKALLDEINASPVLTGVLYDLNLLPETVNDEPGFTSRRAMIAVVFAYKTGAAK